MIFLLFFIVGLVKQPPMNAIEILSGLAKATNGTLFTGATRASLKVKGDFAFILEIEREIAKAGRFTRAAIGGEWIFHVFFN